MSRICARVDVEVDAFRNRSLAHVEFSYIYLDATYVKARDTDLNQVVFRAVVIATGHRLRVVAGPASRRWD